MIAWPVSSSALADHRRLGDLRVRDDRRLDLRRREPVPGDVDDVVDASDDPEVAVLVLARGVADEVGRLAELREVGLLEALVVAEQRAHHPRPGPLDDQQPLLAVGHLVAVLVDDRRLDPRQRPASPSRAWPTTTPGSGEIRMWPVSVCHQVSTTGQRSPPITFQYQSQAFGLIGSPTVPSSRSDERSCLLRVLDAPLHAGADRRRRGVEERHAVALDQLPPDVLVGVVRSPLPHHRGRAVEQRPVDDVGVAGDPADVGRAPVHVLLGLEVEDVLVRPGDAGQVAAGAVLDALRLGGRAGRVEDVERVLGVERRRPRSPRTRPRSPRRRRGRGPRSCRRRRRCCARRRPSRSRARRRGTRRPPA